jgi:NAD-dependent malate dehydrogenase
MTFKVCVIGAAGGIGQPLSLLLKRNNNITQLSLYDVSQSLKGVAMDLSHIDSPTLVSYDCGEESSSIYKALQGARIVVILAGVTRKPGMTRDDIFTLNAGIIRKAAENIANACPEAMCCIVTNPVNSLVPVFIETLKSFNISECERRVFGVTKLDCSRANTFISEEKNIPVLAIYELYSP